MGDIDLISQVVEGLFKKFSVVFENWTFRKSLNVGFSRKTCMFVFKKSNSREKWNLLATHGKALEGIYPISYFAYDRRRYTLRIN